MKNLIFIILLFLGIDAQASESFYCPTKIQCAHYECSGLPPLWRKFTPDYKPIDLPAAEYTFYRASPGTDRAQCTFFNGKDYRNKVVLFSNTPLIEDILVPGNKWHYLGEYAIDSYMCTDIDPKSCPFQIYIAGN